MQHRQVPVEEGGRQQRLDEEADLLREQVMRLDARREALDDPQGRQELVVDVVPVGEEGGSTHTRDHLLAC